MWDESHSGARYVGGAIGAESESFDNPLGYGEGQAENHLKSKIRPHAQFTTPGFEDYFHCW